MNQTPQARMLPPPKFDNTGHLAHAAGPPHPLSWGPQGLLEPRLTTSQLFGALGHWFEVSPIALTISFSLPWASSPSPHALLLSAQQESHLSSLDLWHLGPVGKNIVKHGDPAPDWKATPGVKPAGGGEGVVQQSSINITFVLLLCSLLLLLVFFFFCLWGALELRATGERGLFTEVTQCCPAAVLVGFGCFPS